MYSKEFINLFDKSQLNAIRNSLINKIALIQGPPGTGKTHVGTILTDIILQNMNDDSQILVICFTNHALDSFIENILKFTDSVVRIGGRCQNEKVAEYILDNKKKYSSNNYRITVNNLDTLGEKMAEIASLIDSKRRVSIGLVKKYFEPLYNKVIEDFFKIMDEAIPNKYKGNLNSFKRNGIYRDIYIFWNLIDNKVHKKNTPDRIIQNLLDNSNIENENLLNNLYNKILKGFDGYDVDNLDLLKELNNAINSEKEKNEEIEITNPNRQQYEEEEEEDDDEDDEDELEENKERMNYLDVDIEEKKNNININIYDELYYEDIEDLTNLKPLDSKKYNYLLTSNINFFKIGPKIIKLIINYMKEKLLLEITNYDKALSKFSHLLNEKKEILMSSDAEAIRNYKIVAMTTTGCAKYSTILEKNNFETIIVEEAAEVLEPHILATLTKNTKHLILIGDHKQLRPKPYNYQLEINYNFNVSMFERLINNNISYSSLKYQRRMKKKFAEFVRIIYGETEYQDHPDVLKRPDVLGVEKDMFFITHNKLEGENDGLKSKFNDYEAKYLVKLCKYLLQQGYQTNQITILTFYLGQTLKIKKYLKENLNKDTSKEIRVSSVDNYQGEECDIILLSLVRSNKECKIGFLKTFNRVCVAFSRARIGLYIIGNIDCIIKGEKIIRDKNINNKNFDSKMLDVWQRIKDKSIEMNIINDKLTLICQNHKNKTVIENEKDFAKCPEGGCQEMCKKRMKCGHVCEKVCHVYDCNKNKCLKPCARINKNCRLRIHLCNKKCWEDCEKYGKCEILMDKKLPCGHVQKNIKCCDEPNICEVLVDKKLNCGHIQRIKCCEKTKICEVLVDKKLICGHVQRIKCYENTKICEVLVDKKLICGHIQRIKCCERPKKCNVLVDKILRCGHIQKNVKCYAEPKICEEMVDKKLKCGHIQKNVKCYAEPKLCEELIDKKLRCGHIQKNIKCYENPKKCEEIVEKELPCGHICNKCYCYEDPKNIKCMEKCQRVLKCGHSCHLKCYENCKSQKCHEITKYKISSCNHINDIECYLKLYPTKIICNEPCLQKLKCGHICQGTCGTCLKGTLHIRCNQECSKRLICGHLCKESCSSECICREKCEKICEHNKCYNNCYEVCQNCEEKCGIQCKHKKCMKNCGELCDRKPCNKRCEEIMECGHQCFGLCGERCPNICLICKPNCLNIKKDTVELLYKTYCGHVIKLKDLDKTFDNNNIEIHKCPECKKPLLLEPRYQNKIKSFYNDIRKIKKESYDMNIGNGNDSYYIETEAIIKNLLSQYKSGKINIFEVLLKKNYIMYDGYNLYKKLPIIYDLINKFYFHEMTVTASFYYLMTLAEKFMGVEYYIYLITTGQIFEKRELDFIKNFNEVKKYFQLSSIQFNQYFYYDLERKIDNMLHYTILNISQIEKNGFFSFFCINEKTHQEADNHYFSENINLKNLYPDTLAKFDKRLIFKSLKSKWFKCQNGHIYTLDEVKDIKDVNSCPHCSFSDKAFNWMKNAISKII